MYYQTKYNNYTVRTKEHFENDQNNDSCCEKTACRSCKIVGLVAIVALFSTIIAFLNRSEECCDKKKKK